MKIGKIILFGFIGWIIPYISAFFMYSQEGEVLVDIFLFKTIMILIGNTLGVYLMVMYFKKTKEDILKKSIYLGVIWVIMFWLLDFVALLPLSDMTFGAYFMEIGLRYLLVPVISLGIGYSIQIDREKV